MAGSAILTAGLPRRTAGLTILLAGLARRMAGLTILLAGLARRMAGLTRRRGLFLVPQIFAALRHQGRMAGDT
jgi:hypothetical protein